MASTRHDPRDLPDLLTYLTDPIVEAKHGGGIPGGMAEPDSGATLAVAMATQPKAQTSIH